MKIKLAYERSPQSVVDVVLTVDPTATIGDIATELASRDPKSGELTNRPSRTLAVRPPDSGAFVTLSPTQPMSDAVLASGYTVRVTDAATSSASAADPAASPVAVMRVVSGPDVGKAFNLAQGTSTIGRDPSADCTLSDALVSRHHAQVVVGRTLEVVDLNSANGLLVDGGLVTRVVVQPGKTVMVGDSELAFQWLRDPSEQSGTAVVGGSIAFNRRPVVQPRYECREHPRPEVPGEFEKPPFPWLLMIAPVVLGCVMYLATGNVLSLLFVGMSPMMLTANYLMTRKRTSQQRDSAVGRFRRQLAALEATLAAEQPREREIRNAESPTVAQVMGSAGEHGHLTWTRRPEHWSFLDLRVATGTAPSRNTVTEAGDKAEGLPEFVDELERVVAKYRDIDGVPIVESPVLAGALGFAGDGRMVADAARGLLIQLVGLHSPAEVVVAAVTGSQGAHDFEWLKWLPHTSSAQSPLDTTHLAASEATAAALVASLEALVADRLGANQAPSPRGSRPARLEATAEGGFVGGSAESDDAAPVPAVVVLITDDAPIELSRLVQLAEKGPEAGIYTVWLSTSAQRLPAVCRTFVDLGRGKDAAEIHFVRHGLVVSGASVDMVGSSEADAFARRLAPLVDAGAASNESSDLPSGVSLVSTLGADIAEQPTAVLDRWRQNFAIHVRDGSPPRRLPRPGTLRAIVGQRAQDAMHLDLRTHGPHALVGGTTGSGKSEFLQAWVLGMAAEYSPDRVTFLFVDYKGGAAFANCVNLPHCVGLVTDLSPHLVRRALTSLKAELRHREHLLNLKDAKDILELERRGDPECPPALVIVIDEFAALVGEVPQFVDGVVDIAQRGRSLGIHLIMATQRPAGVIRDNLRANTNLRIALRMADEADSVDVVGSAVASAIDASLPGRAIAKTGPGRLVPFQSAYAGGWTSNEVPKPPISVHELRFGAEIEWETIEPELERNHDEPTDQIRLVNNISAAALVAAIPAPRRPWLNELGKAYDVAALGPRHDRAIVLAVVDRPEDQLQESAFFRPDVDGNLAVYGTGGSGKSVVLRTLAAAAGITPRGGPVHVYALDFAAGGLKMLEVLPHVGAVVAGEDGERVVRLLRFVKDIAERRAREYPAANAGSITEFREITGRQDEPRILLLVDGFPAFRAEYETASRSSAYGLFQQLLSEGRQLGIHVVFTADRPGSVPGSVASSVPRRVVLRLAEEPMYTMLDVASDVLDVNSPPGRAVIDGSEAQIAILGGSGNVADQFDALARLAQAIRSQNRPPAPPIRSLPTQVAVGDLPDEVAGRPVLGIGDDDLAPTGFLGEGVFLLGGGPGSGRSNALAALALAVRRADPECQMYYLGNRRSKLASSSDWFETATTPDEVRDLATTLAELVSADSDVSRAVFIESLADFFSTPADAAIVGLVKAVKRSSDLLVAESETSTWSSSYPLFAEIKAARRGLLLQPDSLEGETLLRTPFPRVSRSEFPQGRGLYAEAGKVLRVQMPLV